MSEYTIIGGGDTTDKTGHRMEKVVYKNEVSIKVGGYRMVMEKFQGYDYVNGGVCAAKGFQAAGMNCGINPDKSKNDLGLLYSEKVCQTAAVYTQNKVKGAPITVTMDNMKKSGNLSHAVIVNSKNANTCNINGEEIATKVCELTAKELSIKPEEVVVASTGVIGEQLDIAPFEKGIPILANNLSVVNNHQVVQAIMTTDTVEKEVAVTFSLQGQTCTMGGMAKGSGMIHPNMATTLNFITTDVAISAGLLQKALSEVVKITYNCLYVDGDTSTNDMVSVMANGVAGNDMISKEDEDYEIVKKALYIVMMNMTRMLAADGEGASKLLECTCKGAKDLDTAIAVAKSVVGSDLVKCAMFGEDANFGRFMCAIGYAPAEFDIHKVNAKVTSKAGEIETCKEGIVIPFSEEEAANVLKEEEICIEVDLQQGDVSAKAWGCDLTYDYVKINGEYRS